MSERGYQIRNQQAIHFITFAVVEWVDVFTRSMYADIVVESLKFCQQQKGLKIYGWSIMSNHLHLIVSASNPKITLSDILRDFKKFTSNQIIKSIENNERESRKSWMLWLFKKAGECNKRNENYQFWQQENHPIECSRPEILASKLKYLHENPVKAGLVLFEGDWRYSSGVDYFCDTKGLLEICLV